MVTICQQCGDKGFENAFIYCVKCLYFAVHRYCLPKLPDTFDEFVHWFCVDCEAKPAKLSALDEPCSIPSIESDREVSLGNEVTQSRVKSKKEDVSCSVSEEDGGLSSPSEKPCDKKTKINSSINDHEFSKGDEVTQSRIKLKEDVSCSVSEEDEGLSSPSQKPCDKKTKINPSINAQLECDSDLKRIKLKGKNKNATHSVDDEPEEQKRQSSPSQQLCEAHIKHDLCLGSSSPPSKKTNAQPCSENHENDLKCGKRRKLIVEGDSKLAEVAEAVSVTYTQTTTVDVSNILEQNYHLHAQPIIDPVWRGSFGICNKGIYGVMGHLSSKACPKVWEEAVLLPELLCVEMLPKSAVWPQSFQRSEPSDENIALYFFPGNKRYEEDFMCLVDDMMNQELALRAVSRNAELLVFPSCELPLFYWKFQGKDYLWGVFRNKQASSSSPKYQHLAIQNGNTDIVVHTNLANYVRTGEERNLTKTKTWDARSPLSPLSNSSEVTVIWNLKTDDASKVRAEAICNST